MSEWQPIETAPKDGSGVDLFGSAPGYPRGRAPDCAWKHLADGPDWYTRGDGGWQPLGAIGWSPTHWMPLPPSPANGDGQ